MLYIVPAPLELETLNLGAGCVFNHSGEIDIFIIRPCYFVLDIVILSFSRTIVSFFIFVAFLGLNVAFCFVMRR